MVSDEMVLVANRHGQIVGAPKGHPQRGNELTAANARSVLQDRLALGRHGTAHGGDRDYNEVLGYPIDLGLEDYLGKYERDPLAGTIINFPPEETWRDTPRVKDGRDKDATDDTRFAQAWSGFAEQLRVYHYCARADTLAGIGRFGVLLIGVAGSGELSEPVTKANSPDDIIYLRPYSEDSVEVRQYETDPQSRRFGLPALYNLAMTDLSQTGVPSQNRSVLKVPVHHSRIIHIAEGLLENEIFGRPRLQRVYNLLDDILKVAGGSAEATWKLMRKGFVLNIDPEARIDPEQVKDLEEQFSEYDHGLRRYLRTKGMTVHDLGSEVIDPQGLFNVIVSLIAAATRIPQRILLGSERGELASSQDGANWAGHIASRQLNFAEPVILRPLIDRMIGWGALPEPETGKYSIAWEPLFEMNDIEKAKVAQVWADTFQRLAAATGRIPVTLDEFRAEFTPFAEQIEGATLPDMGSLPGMDVLDQVDRVIANHGYSDKESRAIVVAAARLLSREG